MSEQIRPPWIGMALVALTIAGLYESGVSLPALALTALVWPLTLWLAWRRPEPEPAPIRLTERPDTEALQRAAMRAAIEPVGVPLALADTTRIIAANASARDQLGGHIVGQDSRVAFRHPDAVRLLDLAEGGSVTIRGLTTARSLWQLTRRRINADYWLIELRDRTSEADLGRAHTDFVANASHELRTPLSSIIGYVETITDVPEQVDADTTRRFLATVLREARRMQELVADLMSLSQLEAEKHDAPTDRVDIGGLAARVAGEFAHLQARGQPRVQLTPPARPLEVAGDAKQLGQLLRNLIDNALKYGDAERPVAVAVAAVDGGFAELAVRDHGAGIAPEHLPHLTRRFYRTDPGRSRMAGGTGLGLAIVKHIVERHRGKLDISSQLGSGTLVSVRLPLAAPTAAAPADLISALPA